jgi:hypothetical protein
MRILAAILLFAIKVIVMIATTIAASMGITAMNITPYQGDGLLLIAVISALSIALVCTADWTWRTLGAGQRQ